MEFSIENPAYLGPKLDTNIANNWIRNEKLYFIYKINIFLVTFRSLTGEVHRCCCLLFVLFTLKIAKNTNGVQYKELRPPWHELWPGLNLINHIFASGCRLFAGINTASTLDAIIIEERILPELDVYFWLMMPPLTDEMRWSPLLGDIKFRVSPATIYHPSISPSLSDSTHNLYVSPHERLINYSTEPMTIPKQSHSPTIKPAPRT